MQAYARWVSSLSRDPAIPGDIIRNPIIERVGIVLKTHLERDYCPMYEIRILAPDTDDHLERGWYSWGAIERASPDPYRRYLAMCAAEDDPDRRAARAGRSRPARRCGEHLPIQAWEKMYWQLANWQHLVPNPMDPRWQLSCGGPLGRDAWKDAYLDCLRRRDRSRTAYFAQIA